MTTCRVRRVRFDLIACGSTATKDYQIGLSKHPNAWNILLKDSEGEELPGAARNDHFWMVELMEAWFLADPEAVEIRRALDNYIALAIERDWPQMALEGKSRDVTSALNGVYATAVRLAQSGSRPSAILFAMFNQLDSLTQARRSRLHLSTGIVPPMLWVVLTLGGVLTVAFTFFFGTKNLRAQA